MTTDTHYAILGDGRLARHMRHYLQQEGQPCSGWARNPRSAFNTHDHEDAALGHGSKPETGRGLGPDEVDDRAATAPGQARLNLHPARGARAATEPRTGPRRRAVGLDRIR